MRAGTPGPCLCSATGKAATLKGSAPRLRSRSFDARNCFYGGLGGPALLRHPLGLAQGEARQGLWLSAGQAFPRAGGNIQEKTAGKERARHARRRIGHALSRAAVCRAVCRLGQGGAVAPSAALGKGGAGSRARTGGNNAPGQCAQIMRPNNAPEQRARLPTTRAY